MARFKTQLLVSEEEGKDPPIWLCNQHVRAKSLSG